MTHDLSTCMIPLSALGHYYRRNLCIPPGSAARRLPLAIDRYHDVRIAVESGVDEHRPGSVDVTVVEFAAHTAYLELVTGTGFLVAPLPETDVAAPNDWFVEVAWSNHRSDYGRTGGLSLQTADRVHALELLERDGWTLLDDENGKIETAGRTTDDRLAVCLYAGRSRVEPLVLEDLQRAITALHTAADLQHTS